MSDSRQPSPRIGHVRHRVQERVWSLVERISDTRHGLYGLAVLRVGYGLILLGVLLVNHGDRRLLWGPESPWTKDLFTERLAEKDTFSLFALADSDVRFDLLYHAFVILAVLFALGWRTRWVTPVLVVMLWSWRERQPWLLDGGDDVMLLVLIYLCFADLSARWSMDARRAKRRAGNGAAEPVAAPANDLRWRMATILHNSALLAVLVQVCIIYVDTGLLKVRGELWQEGTALYYILHVEDIQPFPGLSRAVYDNMFLVILGSYAAVFLQLSFPLLMLNRVTRALGLIAVTGMHLGIGLLMGLVSFSLIMIATDLLFIRDSTYERFACFVRTARMRHLRHAMSST
ncbi:HTTM domain-containing protein, partial [Nonomuraea sp. RK-328]|nr:HTTM domain-containing protein [Nonomuraea sp. RK-328]